MACYFSYLLSYFIEFFFFVCFYFYFIFYFFLFFFFFFQAEDGIRDADVTGVQTCALPISTPETSPPPHCRAADARDPPPASPPTPPRAPPPRYFPPHSAARSYNRSEEHTSELQSRPHLVCRLLLEKKKNKPTTHQSTTHQQ